MRPASTLRALLRRMIVDADAEQKCADAIGQLEGWIAPPLWRRNRLMQCLRGVAGRHFEIEWLPLVLQIVVARGGADLITGQLHQAVSDGMRERDERADRLEREPRAARAGLESQHRADGPGGVVRVAPGEQRGRGRA